ncbi:ATPase [Halomarina oriensis]|uniref:ATPase n=1 Tax=Halomarina oriensis TaxID=671145 RepID=A0A6B0GMT4_9EURY|nr:ATPase [Halomarina oriensis]MWG35970.1 ATPase [Halomarina oriensis]
MHLLVAGGSQVDAGKTTFAAGLAVHAATPAYKPRAGNDYWFDHDDVRHSVADGRLYGKDVRTLATLDDAPPELRNPVHRLWTPAPGTGTGVLGRTDRAFLCDRVTVDGESEFVVNGTVDLPPMLREFLPLEDATRVSSLDEFNDVMADRHRAAFDGVAERVAAEGDVVVESYADIARPLDGFAPDAVAVVEPARLRVFDGARYAKACEVASGSAHEGRLEERVENVLEYLDPLERRALEPLADEVRSDPAAVATAYADHYDALLAVTDA